MYICFGVHACVHVLCVDLCVHDHACVCVCVCVCAQAKVSVCYSLAHVDGAHFWCRFPILACRVMYVTTTTMSVEDVYLCAGQLPRPFCTGSTPQRVMCGVMGW